jgi:MFS family permease
MDSCNIEKFIVGFLPAVSIVLIMLAFSTTLPMFIVVGALWGIGAAFFIPIAMIHAFDYVGCSAGSGVGTFRAMQDLGLGLGPVIMGLIVPLTGYRVMFLCLAAICLLNMGYFQFYVRRRM